MPPEERRDTWCTWRGYWQGQRQGQRQRQRKEEKGLDAPPSRLYAAWRHRGDGRQGSRLPLLQERSVSQRNVMPVSPRRRLHSNHDYQVTSSMPVLRKRYLPLRRRLYEVTREAAFTLAQSQAETKGKSQGQGQSYGCTTKGTLCSRGSTPGCPTSVTTSCQGGGCGCFSHRGKQAYKE